MQQQILGLSGKKQSGKNTAGNQIIALQMGCMGFRCRINEFGKLVTVITDSGDEGILDFDSRNPQLRQWLASEIWPWVKTYSFADPLKEFCINVFGLSEAQCYGTDADKNTLTELCWANMPGIPMEQKRTDRMTAREVLQYFGTNVCRQMLSNCWVDATIRRIQNEGSALAIVTDVRFPNEVEGIQKVGGKVIRLTRAPFAGDSHPSETALDNYDGFDYVLDNPNSSIAEQGEMLIAKLVEWEWFKVA